MWIALARSRSARPGGGAFGAASRRSQRLDFVLCTRDKLSPVLVIELDDASHEEESRRDRDTFVDAALTSDGLPILHIPAQRSYVPADLAAAIQRKIR